MTKEKIDFNQLAEGYKFSPAVFTLDAALVKAYVEAVEETGPLYRESRLVPPMAVVALAMAELSQSVAFPEGAIHVSQDVEFLGIVHVDDMITSQAAVVKKQKRGPLNLLTIEFRAFDKDSQGVVTGKTEFILPVSSS
jgi:acyl dehydratase